MHVTRFLFAVVVAVLFFAALGHFPEVLAVLLWLALVGVLVSGVSQRHRPSPGDVPHPD